MRRLALPFCALALSLCSCAAPAPPRAPGGILPLRTVRLYETGVGYFERTGQVSTDEGTSLPVPAAHLDDALKTLVVLGEGGGAVVDGLEFGSSVSQGMARALAGLPKDSGEAITYLKLLSSLRGDEVEVETTHGRFVGAVVDVLEPPPEPKAAPAEDDENKSKHETAPERKPELVLLLLTQQNEIRSLPSTDIRSVRPTSSVTTARLGLAVTTLSSRAAQSRRNVRVMTRSAGPVTLGYIAETPLWRTTYRVVLGDRDGQATLQGWALLHNDTDEDWKHVRVQLVNGRPDSFLFPLASPRYGRRELVAPEHELSTIPQLLDRTPDGIWGDHAGLEAADANGMSYGSGAGYGMGSHRTSAPSIRMGATTVSSRAGASDLLQIGNLASVQEATGVESAALFIYTLPQPLDLRPHGSALVPFVGSPVSAKRITWIDGSSDVPRMAVRFENTTRQTLPPGPIAFFADGGFAGESGLDRLKPQEHRYLQFGADLDVEVSRSVAEATEETRTLRFRNDALEVHYVRFERWSYEIENRGGQPRSVHWPLDVVANAKVTGADEVVVDNQVSKPIAVFAAAPRKKATREVTTEQGLSRSTRLQDLRADWLQSTSEIAGLAPEQKKVMADAAERRKKADATEEAQRKTQSAIEEVEKDLERLREHLKALGSEKGAGAANPFVKRILDAEDRLSRLRATTEALGKEKTERMDALRTVLAQLAPAARAGGQR